MTESIKVWLPIITSILSFLTLLIVFFQIRLQRLTAKSEIAINLIDKIYNDAGIQHTLRKIYRDELEYYHDGVESRSSLKEKSGKDITDEIDFLLNRFQILGHLYDIGVLTKKDLKGLRFEIISIGRNESIREYLKYLNNIFVIKTGVSHDHFSFYKKLYLEEEYDKEELKSFKMILQTRMNLPK